MEWTRSLRCSDLARCIVNFLSLVSLRAFCCDEAAQKSVFELPPRPQLLPRIQNSLERLRLLPLPPTCASPPPRKLSSLCASAHSPNNPSISSALAATDSTSPCPIHHFHLPLPFLRSPLPESHGPEFTSSEYASTAV